MKKNAIIAAAAAVVLAVSVFAVLSHTTKSQGGRQGKSASLKNPELEALFSQGGDYIAKGDLLKAKEIYEKIISTYPDAGAIEEAQKTLWDLNIKLLFSPLKTQDAIYYQVEPRDNLWKLAKKFKTTIPLIKKANNLQDDRIRAGMRLKITTAKFSVLVDKSQNTLILKKGEEVVKLYRVSTGENNSSPVGTFKVVNKLENPVWYKTNAVVPAGSPENILGSRWLGIDKPGYGIHGTTDPASIGSQVTAGCVRMINSDVEELYDILAEGAEVVIVD